MSEVHKGLKLSCTSLLQKCSVLCRACSHVFCGQRGTCGQGGCNLLDTDRHQNGHYQCFRFRCPRAGVGAVTVGLLRKLLLGVWQGTKVRRRIGITLFRHTKMIFSYFQKRAGFYRATFCISRRWIRGSTVRSYVKLIDLR